MGVSPSHVVSAALSSSWRTVHALLLIQCGIPPTADSRPWTSPMGVLPMGNSSSWTAPVCVPSTGCILQNRLLQCGFLHGLQVDICSTINIRGLQGNSLHHQGLHRRLQGNLLQCLNHLLRSFSTDLGVCRAAFLTCSWSWEQLLRWFLSLLSYVIPEVLPLLLMGLALAFIFLFSCLPLI